MRPCGCDGVGGENHRNGCYLQGKRQSGKGGKRGPLAEEARKARQVNITLEGGTEYASGCERLRAAARRMGYASGSELVAAVVARIEAGKKLFLGPDK